MEQTKTFPFGQEIVWWPDPNATRHTNLGRFMERHGIASYDELMRRSTDDVAWFWQEALDDLGIEFYEPYTRILDTERGVPFARWCVDGQMNIVHNLIDRWRGTPVWKHEAIRWEGEEGITLTLTYEQLDADVCRCASALQVLGVGRGDVVGLFMPMTPELVVALLAIAKIGAILLPLFSGYGPGAIAGRLADAGAVAVFTANGFYRRGREVAMKPVLDEALLQCPTVRHVVVHERIAGMPVPMEVGRDHTWYDLVASRHPEMPTARTSAEAPLMIIYTSGTTGRPKGALHTHCGFPIKAAQDMYHAMDVRRGEMVYWMTDMGWMMGPWLVFGTLAIGAGMMLYDGAPDYPDAGRVWRMVQDHRVTLLGLSPVLVRTLMPKGPEPIRSCDLSRLRAIGSTGSPWDPDSWRWIFEHALERKKPILNYSGGTEISGGILCGNFLQPLKPCAFSGPVPGMDADVVDDRGIPVREQVGELIIRKPWIGMTRGFWKDEARYLDAYWRRFEGVWHHGDFAAIDEDGLWYILGRSDDTIKIAGKRIGPSEIEAVVCAHDGVAECAAVAVPHPIKDEEVVVFVVLVPGRKADEVLRKEIAGALVAEFGKALAPRAVKFTTALPKTRNAKVMRRIIRAAYLGLDPGDTSSLEDPGTVRAIREAV